uniref:Uncharacterized protein n=1 Tax=Anopheles quadriannulatus TaxID=34691 RepID=A0A182XT45_ANOQN
MANPWCVEPMVRRIVVSPSQEPYFTFMAISVDQQNNTHFCFLIFDVSFFLFLSFCERLCFFISIFQFLILIMESKRGVTVCSKPIRLFGIEF